MQRFPAPLPAAMDGCWGGGEHGDAGAGGPPPAAAIAHPRGHRPALLPCSYDTARILSPRRQDARRGGPGAVEPQAGGGHRGDAAASARVAGVGRTWFRVAGSALEPGLITGVTITRATSRPRGVWLRQQHSGRSHRPDGGRPVGDQGEPKPCCFVASLVQRDREDPMKCAQQRQPRPITRSHLRPCPSHTSPWGATSVVPPHSASGWRRSVRTMSHGRMLSGHAGLHPLPRPLTNSTCSRCVSRGSDSACLKRDRLVPARRRREKAQ